MHANLFKEHKLVKLSPEILEIDVVTFIQCAYIVQKVMVPIY